MHDNKLFLLLVMLCFLTPAPQNPLSSEDSGDSAKDVRQEVVVRVNGEPVSMTEFSRAVARQYGHMAIDWFVESILIEQAAEKHGIAVSAGDIKERKKLEVKLRFMDFFRRTRMTPALFDRVSGEYGWTRDELRNEIDDSISQHSVRRDVLLEQLLESRIDISQEELEQYYAWNYGKRVAGAQIVVESRDEARMLASELQNDMDSWSELVREFSLNRRSTPYGGRFQPVPAKSDLGRALTDIGTNGIGFYRSGQKWHVIRQTERIAPHDTPMDDMIPQLKKELRAIKTRDRSDKYIASLRERATIVPNIGHDPQQRGIMGRDVIAFVNGQEVPVTRFGRAMIRRFGRNIIEPFVEQRLVLQAAQKENVTVNDKRIQERMERMASDMEVSVNDRPTEDIQPGDDLWSASRTMEAKRGDTAETAMSPTTVRALLLAEKMTGERVYVDEQEIRSAYETRYGRHVQLQVIVTDDAARARALRQRAAEGAHFALLARIHSGANKGLDPAGFRTYAAPGDAYYEHVEKLNTGEIAPVLRHNGRYHLLKLIDRNEGDNPPAFDRVRDQIKRRVKEEKRQRRIEAWLNKLKAESRVQIIKQFEL